MNSTLQVCELWGRFAYRLLYYRIQVCERAKDVLAIRAELVRDMDELLQLSKGNDDRIGVAFIGYKRHLEDVDVHSAACKMFNAMNPVYDLFTQVLGSQNIRLPPPPIESASRLPDIALMRF